MAEFQCDTSGLSVMLAMPVHRDIPWQTVKSLIETQRVMNADGIPFEIRMNVGGSVVQHARSKCAHDFLKSDCNRLFWVDSDIAWEATDFIRLVALSTKMDVVGGIYTAKRDPPRFFLNIDKGEPLQTNGYGCLPVKGMGLGFTIVQRHIMEKLAAAAPHKKLQNVDELVPQIFRCDSEGDEARGEDMAFFADVRELGVSVFIDPRIQLSHIGQKAYTASFMDALTPTN